MHLFFDTETHRFRPGLMAPPIVCVQFCTEDGAAQLMTKRGEFAHEGGSLSPPSHNTFSSLLAYWLEQGATLVGHHVAYDLACFCAQDSALVPLVFRAYRESRVTDTMLRQKLADIGRGKHRGFQAGGGWVALNYDLGSVAGRHGLKVDKQDPWRLHYSLLADVPLADWPGFVAHVPDERKGAKPGDMVGLRGEAAIHYALQDALATRAAFAGQAARYNADLLCDEFFQARKFWALDLASTWGLRTSLRGVQSLERGAQERLNELQLLLQHPTDERGRGELPLVRADGSRDTKAAKQRMLAAWKLMGLPPRLTKGGAKGPDVCLDSDACNSCGDPLLEAYAEYSSMKKVLSNDVEMLRGGTVVPIHTHFDMADTGRVTSSKPNTMNPRRLPGVRECFVPRGYGAAS